MAIDKKENFVRLAEARTNKLIDSIELLGNLSNRSYYDFTMEQVNNMFDAIQRELDAQRLRFSETETKKKKFRL